MVETTPLIKAVNVRHSNKLQIVPRSNPSRASGEGWLVALRHN